MHRPNCRPPKTFLIGTTARNYTAGSPASPNFFRGGSQSPRSGRHHVAHGASRGKIRKWNVFFEPRQGRHQHDEPRRILMSSRSDRDSFPTLSCVIPRLFAVEHMMSPLTRLQRSSLTCHSPLLLRHRTPFLATRHCFSASCSLSPAPYPSTRRSSLVAGHCLYPLPKKTDGETWKRWLSRAMWPRFSRRLPERTSDTVLSLPSSAAMSRCESPF